MHDACRLMQLWGDFQLRWRRRGDVGVDQASWSSNGADSSSTCLCLHLRLGLQEMSRQNGRAPYVGPVLEMFRGTCSPQALRRGQFVSEFLFGLA